MTEEAAIDLDAYFARIGYEGPRTPTLDTLKAIHYAQAVSIPFENLDVLAKRPINLDLPSLQKKLIAEKRGGYCFEVNALFAAALRAIGFDITTLIGRVRWLAPEEAEAGRTHMLLRVDLPEGPFIADAGFGGLTMTGPIRFETGTEQETPHEPRRLLAHGDGFELQGKLGDKWAPIYRFTEEVQTRTDYELSSWYTSTHPSSIFVQFLVVARPFPDRRVTLFNTELTIRHLDGRVETRRLDTPEEIAAALDEYFGIPLSEEDRALALAPYFEQWRTMG